MNLGKRLSAALELLAECDGSIVADIGSDHAYLAVAALKSGAAKRAIASDINPGPLESGRANAKLHGADIEFVLSDGFDALEDKGVTAAAICGMGGETIAAILEKSACAKKCRLILQPMSGQEKLRAFLYGNGYRILRERFVTDCGKPYTVMLVKYTGISEEFTYTDLYLGKERPEGADFALYAEKEAYRAEKRLRGNITSARRADENALIRECQMHSTNFSAGTSPASVD